MTIDADSLIANLRQMQVLREPTLRAAIDALDLQPGSRGVDIGCGIGDVAHLLAEATKPDGHVTGLDISWQVLDHARRKADRSVFADRIAFEVSDMRVLPFPVGIFDWAISVDCLGYPAGDLLPDLKRLRRVLRPGGLIALLAWTSQQLLPGHSMLEARLNACCSAYAPFLVGLPSEAHFQRAVRWFPEAGLGAGACRTFIGHLQAPLSPGEREGVALLFEMLWGTAIGGASQADSEEYRRLCSPASQDFIADLPEYCGFFTYTMFSGRVVELT